jgi:demethylmenaquinone methyltransferase/2-methoxy-6-polyprenyl-1,4-benzoquinol methylase
MTNLDDLLSEQLDYYRARAQEYDDSVQQMGHFNAEEIKIFSAEWDHIASIIRSLPHAKTGLELACGTGLWTKILLEVVDKVTALDGAQEMLDINKAKLKNERVSYQKVDLFAWQPENQYDLVFGAFWLSHVPPDLLANQLKAMASAVRPGGSIFLVDEPAGGKQASGPVEGEFEQLREISDGRKFRIVKTYVDYASLKGRLAVLGFQDFFTWVNEYSFYITAVRSPH